MLPRMVSDLLRGRCSLFLQIPFRRFALAFIDGFEINLTINPRPSQKTKTLKLSLRKDGEQKEIYGLLLLSKDSTVSYPVRSYWGGHKDSTRETAD